MVHTAVTIGLMSVSIALMTAVLCAATPSEQIAMDDDCNIVQVVAELLNTHNGQMDARFEKIELALSKITSRLESIEQHVTGQDPSTTPATGCPADFFSINGRPECYKLLFESGPSNWTEAINRCNEEGLSLAQPPHEAAAALMKHISDTHGNTSVWLGAYQPFKGPDNAVVWRLPHQEILSGGGLAATGDWGIPNDSEMWHPWGKPGSGELQSYDNVCVFLGVYGTPAVADRPDIWLYGLNDCQDFYNSYTLCQAQDKL